MTVTQIAAPKKLRQQFADTMLAVGKEDPKLVVMIGDISHTILQPFAQACPGRFYNIGICEPTIVSMAAGMAKTGLFPVVHTIAPFLIERSFEQIKLDCCYQKLGINLVTVGSMFDYSNLGCSHHCYGDFALLKTLPGVQVIYPASPAEFDSLFRQTYSNGKVTVYRLPEYQHGQEIDPTAIQFGKGIKMTDGTNLTIVAAGPQLSSAMSARDALKDMGWDAEIIYIPTIRPLDEELIRASVRKTRRVLVIEEHMRSGGVGDDVLRAVKDIGRVQYSSLSIPDVFVHDYGSYDHLCQITGLCREGVLKRVAKEFAKESA